MNIAHKIANKHFDEIADASTRHTSRHGVPKHVKRASRKVNKRVRREESKIDFNDAWDCAEREYDFDND